MAVQQAHIVITGRVGTQPVAFGNDPQHSGCKFRLASTRVYRDRLGQWQELPTTWITVKAFRQLAQNVMFAVHRGDPVIVSGALGNEEWDDAEGKHHVRVVIEAATVGHDLNFGVTTLRKFEKERQPEPMQPQPMQPQPIPQAFENPASEMPDAGPETLEAPEEPEDPMDPGDPMG